MSRYTNKDSLIDAIKMAFEDEEDGYQIMHGSYWNAEMVVSFIKDFPTADVIPVVHCKDCKKYAREEWKRKLDEPHNFADTEWKMECGCMGFDDPEKGYCYAGERKGES